MKAIIQKVKNVTFGQSNVAQGVIVFILEDSNFESILKKVLKIKMWNNWKDSVVDLDFKIFVVFEGEVNKEINEIEGASINEIGKTLINEIDGASINEKVNVDPINEKIIFLDKKEINYTNDGPCTFLLE